MTMLSKEKGIKKKYPCGRGEKLAWFPAEILGLQVKVSTKTMMIRYDDGDLAMTKFVCDVLEMEKEGSSPGRTFTSALHVT
jgi:hypothetical protein